MTNTPIPLAVAFDLDDTLYAEQAYVDACLRHVSRAFASLTGCDSNELYRRISEAQNPYDALCEIAGEHAPTISEFLDVYRNTHPGSLPLREDARRILDRLAASGAALYLITDGRSIGQRAKIAALGLEKYFGPEHIIISEETGADKTTVVPFITAMEREPDDTSWTYIGDNPAKDFLWPRRLGWNTVMLRDLAGENVHPQDLARFSPEHAPLLIVDSLDEVTVGCRKTG